MKRGGWIPTLVLIVGATLAMSGYSASAADRYKPMCPYDNFPNLSNSTGAGANYSKPDVTVACTASEVIVESNGMTSFPFSKMTPNSLKEQSWVWRIPLSPKVATTTTSIKNVLGTLGFTVSGLPIYGPTEGSLPALQAYGDPVYNKVLDACGGHAGPSGEYHQHAIVASAQCNLSQQSLVGYALDGFPIYSGPACANIACTASIKMTSGYVMTGNPTTNSWDAYKYVKSSKPSVLDACNGRIEPDGTYAYHATDTFPYIIGCYKGTPTQQVGKGASTLLPMKISTPRGAMTKPQDGEKRKGATTLSVGKPAPKN